MSTELTDFTTAPAIQAGTTRATCGTSTTAIAPTQTRTGGPNMSPAASGAVSPMSDAVTRARELLAEATPGPWACGDYAIAYPQGGVGFFWEVTTSDYDDTISCQIDSRDDAELIAAAPTLLAELADEVERLRAALHLRDTTPKPPENAAWHWSLISNSDYTKVCAENARLRARLDAVLAIHSDRDGDCAECEMSTGQGVDWPCWTYNAAIGVES